MKSKSDIKMYSGNPRNIKSLRKSILILSTISIFATMTWAAIQAASVRIVIIGDSTAYTYTESDPLKGWGQKLEMYFKPGAATVINKSIGGRSSRSFIEDGHWTSVKALLQKGDFLIISFGTNDAGSVAERHTDTAGFRKYLSQYVTEGRAKGVIPILASTVCQNDWKGSELNERFTIGVNDYRGAMLRVVNALDVPFIDLEKKSAALYKSLGQKFLQDNYFSGGNTHFNSKGATEIAKLVATGIAELSSNAEVAPLAAALGPQFEVTPVSLPVDRAHRDPTMNLSAQGMLAIVADENIASVRIADINGKTVLSREPNRDMIRLDIGFLTHGTYFVSMRTAGQVIMTETIQR
ncbi:MAG: rhamnogalacturonan acetylesterase [Fibrobacteria bacterium]